MVCDCAASRGSDAVLQWIIELGLRDLPLASAAGLVLNATYAHLKKRCTGKVEICSHDTSERLSFVLWIALFNLVNLLSLHSGIYRLRYHNGLVSYRGGGTSRREYFAVGYFAFKFVRNFPRNFQAAVRNKPAAKFSKMSCPTVA